MPRTEKAENVVLGALLENLRPRWAVRWEETGRVEGAAGLQPDITIDVPRAAPVVIEVEFSPAVEVEQDAQARLGVRLVDTPTPVETVVAVILPQRFRAGASGESFEDRRARLAASNDVQWALFTQQAPSRRPGSGWISGSPSDLAATIESVLVSRRRLDEAADALERAGNIAAGMSTGFGGAVHQRISEVLHQESSEQTWKMAASIVVNAFLFQEAIAAHHSTPDLDAVRSRSRRSGDMSKREIIRAFEQIMEVNYVPIFSVALEIIRLLHGEDVLLLCKGLAEAAETMRDAGANQVQDMTGQLFGTMIADRKFLATFYTLPAAAALLAELALDRLDVDWADANAVAALRIADFACGTGSLLSAAYRRTLARARRSELDDAALHTALIENGLIGADIMPAAAHLTTTMLASAQPQTSFGHCGIHLVDYGSTAEIEANGKPGANAEIAIGSLELLGEGGVSVSHWRDIRRIERTSGVENGAVPHIDLDDGTLDLCIMNPPYTRPTNHETAAAAGVPVPSFAGLGTEDEHQAAMSARLKVLSRHIRKPRAGHGNAGLASNFLDLAFAKTRPGGVIAFVLPFSSIAGGAWAGAREMFERYCDDVTFVSIASHGTTQRAFSADTHMAEALVIARKAPVRKTSVAAKPLWVSLRARPTSETEAVWAAQAIRRAEGDSASGRVLVGDDVVGYVLRGDMDDGPRFSAIADPDLAICAAALARGNLELPRHASVPLPLCELAELGMPGPVHRDINGADPRTGAARGPFDLEKMEPGQAASYPVLWAHDAGSGRESALEVAPDRLGRSRLGMRDSALRIWTSATRLHLNCDFQVNSQPLGACLTAEPTIGGRAWPSFLLHEPGWEPIVALWLNTTLGLIARWSVSGRQQQGRANLTVTTLGRIPVLDPRSLTDRQVAALGDLAERERHEPMLPANEAYRDTQRHLLDVAVLHDILGLPSDVLDALEMMRLIWCSEPSVHGGKRTRPTG